MLTVLPAPRPALLLPPALPRQPFLLRFQRSAALTTCRPSIWATQTTLHPPLQLSPSPSVRAPPSTRSLQHPRLSPPESPKCSPPPSAPSIPSPAQPLPS